MAPEDVEFVVAYTQYKTTTSCGEIVSHIAPFNVIISNNVKYLCLEVQHNAIIQISLINIFNIFQYTALY